MAAWEATGPRRPAGLAGRPARPATPRGGQKHDLLDDGSILAAGYAPTKHTTEFTAERLDRTAITAVRLELLNDPSLPLRRARAVDPRGCSR